MRRRQDDVIFCVASTWGLTPYPIHVRPPEPGPSPLRVDVINGWPIPTERPNYGAEEQLSDA